MRERCPTCHQLKPQRIAKTRSKPRRGPMRDQKYRRWCREQRCAVSGVPPGPFIIDPAHTENGGMRCKGPDSSCVPLERSLHLEYDRGRMAFEAGYGVDMRALAKEYYAAYLKETSVET